MIRTIAITSILINMLLIMTVEAEDKMPLNAESGQCFTKAFYPPKVSKTIRTTSVKRIKLSESAVKYEVIPAKYTWDEKRIKVSDAIEKLVVIPATYKNVLKKILISPSQKVWRKNLHQSAPKVYNACVEAAGKSGLDIDNAQAGTCYYEHFQAAKYSNITERFLASEASTRVVVNPAIYKTVTQKIETSNATMKLTPVPIKYKKVKEDVTIAPARSEWKKTTCQNRGCNQSEVVCLVEVPRTFKTVTKKVILEQAIAKKTAVKPVYTYVKVKKLVKPSSIENVSIPASYKKVTRRKKIQNEKYFWTDASLENASSRTFNQCNKICLVETPAVYKTISKKVVLNPASVKKNITPEEYKTVKVRKIVQHAAFKTVTVPSEYTEIRVERERTPGYAKWMPMVCESAMVPSLVIKIQKALKNEGYYDGAIDGNWGLEEKSAIRTYQKAKGLAVTKLSIETMKSLNIY